MLSKQEVETHGYTVLPKGGWIYINPEIMPRDWDDVCSDFGLDPDARGAYLCIVGVREEA